MSDPRDKSHASDPNTWVDSYGDYLFGFALTRLRDERLAEDAVQETFLAALKARDRFAGQSSEKTWLVGILKNKIIDHFRKTSREVNLEDFDMIDKARDEDFESEGKDAGQWRVDRRPTDWIIDSSDPAEVGEFWKFLRFCLSELPKHFAAVFVMREIDGYENREICNEMKLKPTNLRVVLHRARKQLRRCLEVNWTKRT